MTKKDFVRRIMPLVPALCTFGPLEMVQGYNSPYHVISEIAALVTAVGILIIYANVMLLIQANEPAHSGEVTAGKTRFGVIAIAAIAALLVAGVAFYLMAHRLA